jgi:hypothetical protein
MAPFTEAEHERIGEFQNDLAHGRRTILASLGCKGLAETLGASDVCLAYANYRLRRIAARPRRVHRSDTLRLRTDLAPEERDAIDAIEERFAGGADLYPHQSTSIASPLSKDGLLADWHIQHLHLGLMSGKPAVPPFVMRSANVLLVRVTDSAAYFIDCLPHGASVDPPWWDIDLAETLHRNWPESIHHLRIEGYEPKLTWEQHRRLRPVKGCSFTTAVSTSDGTSYLLSDGMLAAGYSTAARGFADSLQTNVTEIALGSADDERLVVAGDHRELYLSVQPRET